MRSRIRGAAVIVHEGAIALAKHDDHELDYVWWSPPGGSADGRETILACAEREAMEETSLRVVAERPIYAQELINRHWKNRTLELFILCHLVEGVSPDGIRADNEISEARWFTWEETAGELILPEIFREVVWGDIAAGFPEFRYLGMAEI
jgi:ADP-ribose pyrophosphatase YjhB (NUDIX family)